jgi:hypothetical protein
VNVLFDTVPQLIDASLLGGIHSGQMALPNNTPDHLVDLQIDRNCITCTGNFLHRHTSAVGRVMTSSSHLQRTYRFPKSMLSSPPSPPTCAWYSRILARPSSSQHLLRHLILHSSGRPNHRETASTVKAFFFPLSRCYWISTAQLCYSKHTIIYISAI